MKSQFPGYFPLEGERLKKLWDECLFVFDANILLGLYRYSDATREDFISTIDFIKMRCWLPHQAVKEYFNNRLSVIGNQEQAYTEIIKSISEIELQFRNSKQHPFLSEEALSRLCKEFEAVKAELEESKKSHLNRINNDEILVRIELIFRERVGLPLTVDDLKGLVSEGEDRYKRNIPPGFKDSKKEDPCDELRKFGDLILWKQIIKNASAAKRSVIFVCDDRKEDWWLEFKGRIIGPRPELIKEFGENVGLDFHMYSSDRFLEFAGEHFKRKVSKNSVSEMREMRKVDEDSRNKDNAAMNLRDIRSRLLSEDNEITINVKELEGLENQVAEMVALRERLRELIEKEDPAAIPAEVFEQRNLVARHLDHLKNRVSVLRNEIESGKMRRASLFSRLRIAGSMSNRMEGVAGEDGSI